MAFFKFESFLLKKVYRLTDSPHFKRRPNGQKKAKDGTNVVIIYPAGLGTFRYWLLEKEINSKIGQNDRIHFYILIVLKLDSKKIMG